MKGSGILGLLIIVIFAALGCSAVSLPGKGLLPAGIESAEIPDVDVGGYLYFNTESPVTLAEDFFRATGTQGAQPSRDIVLDKATIVLGTSADELGGVLSFASDGDAGAAWELFQARVDAEQVWGKSSPPNMFLTTNQGAWTDAVKDAYESSRLVSIKERDVSGWQLLTNLPQSPPSPPVAAGVLKLDQGLISSVTGSADIEVDGIGNAFGLVRVDTLGFAIYTETPITISSNIDPQYLRDSNSSILFVSQSTYPGALVAFMLSVMAERTEMELIQLGSTNARYKSIEDLHLIIKNKDSLLYGAVATTRSDAEQLMLSALSEGTGD